MNQRTSTNGTRAAVHVGLKELPFTLENLLTCLTKLIPRGSMAADAAVVAKDRHEIAGIRSPVHQPIRVLRPPTLP